MGLFGSSSKTYTSASASRMIEDKDIKDLHQAAILDYTLTNNDRVDALATSFNEVYSRQVATSLGAMAMVTSKIADRIYYYGTPKGYKIKKDKLDLMSIAEDYLLRITDRVPTVVYSKLGPINYNHAAFYMLQQNYGYSFETNTLLVNGDVHYLEDLTIKYIKSSVDGAINLSYFDPLGLPATFGPTNTRERDTTRTHSQWLVDNTGAVDSVDVHLINVNTGSKSTITLDFLEYAWSGVEPQEGDEAPTKEDPDFFMISYIDQGVRKLITAQYDIGDIPELDQAVTSDVDPGAYMPNLYIYKGGIVQNHKSLQNTEAFKSSVKLCRHMRLNYSEMVDEIYSNISKESSIQTCYITFGLAVNSYSDPIIQEYMFNFFYEMYKDSDQETRSNYDEERLDQIDQQAKSGVSLVLADRAYRSSVSYSSIGSSVKSGSIGKIGTCTGALESFRYGAGGSGVFGRPTIGRKHVFRKQLTANTYREVVVTGLTASYSVAGTSDVTASGNEDELIIPIDTNIITRRMTKHRHALMCKSMHIIVTTKVTIRKKWYQTGIFKVIMFIITVVISYFFPPAGAALYGAYAVAYAVAVAVVITVAVTLVTKLLYAMGLKDGMVIAIIAVIAIIVGAYANLANTSVAGLNATQILAISNVAFAVSNNLTALQMQERYKAYLAYTDDMDAEMEKLEQMRKDLGLDNFIGFDFFELLSTSVYKPDIRLGESPLSFLNRVTNVTSAVDIYLQIVPNYVFFATQLPTIEDTLRGFDSYGSRSI